MTKRGFTSTVRPDGTADSTADSTITTDSRPDASLPGITSSKIRYTPSWHLVRPSLRLLRANTETALIIVLLPTLLLQLGILLAKGATQPTTQAALGVICMLIAVIWLIGSLSTNYYFQLRVLGHDRPTALECYRRGLRYQPRVLGLMLLTGLLTAVGFCLLLVPGLMLFRRYFLAPYFLIDGDLGIREAMERSSKASRSANRYIFGTVAVILVFSAVATILSRMFPVYGNSVASLLTLGYVFVPVLRYKEVGRSERAVK